MDGFAAKQGFEACKRGHGVDFVGMLQAGEDVGFGGGLVGVTGAFFLRDGTDAVAADDIRMGFVDDVGIRIALADGTQQVEVAADFRRTQANGCIVFDLPRDKQDAFFRRPLCCFGAADVVFADVGFDEFALQVLRCFAVMFVEVPVLQDVFQP